MFSRHNKKQLKIITLKIVHAMFVRIRLNIYAGAYEETAVLIAIMADYTVYVMEVCCHDNGLNRINAIIFIRCSVAC